jgi:hypothetical protein
MPKVTDDDVLIVCTGRPKAQRFEYWTHYHNEDSSCKREFLQTLGTKKIRGYGYAYYYQGDKVWFRNKKDLTMYLLTFGK